MLKDDGTLNWPEVIERLTRLVRQRVRNPADADELVQDILERLVRNGEQLLTVGNPVGWMHRIASNAIIDHYRRPRRNVALREVPPSGTADAPEVSRGELLGCLRPLVMHLDPLSREALLATDLGGQSQSDAAHATGIAVSAMKSRIQRGRLKLRQALLRCCHVELDRRNGVIEVSPISSTALNDGPRVECCGAPSRSAPQQSAETNRSPC